MNSVTRSPCSDVGSFVICFYCNESFHSLSSLTKHFCSAEQNNSLDLDPLDDFSDITCIDLAQEDNVISSKCFSETPMQGTTESDTNIFGGNSFSNTEYKKASPCTKEQESNSIVVKVVTKLVNDESDLRLIEPNSDVMEVVTNLVNEISETNFEVIEVIKQGTEASKEKLLVLDTGQKNTDAEPNADEEFNATSPDLVSKVLQCNEKQSIPSTPNNFCKSPSMEIEFQSPCSPIVESSSPRHYETQIECNATNINNTSLTSERNSDNNRGNKIHNESETSENNIISLKPQATNKVSALSPIIESITTIGNIKSLESQPYTICSTPSPRVESDSSNMFSRSSSVDMEFDSLGCDDNQAYSDDSETSNTLLSEKEADLLKDENVPEKLPADYTARSSYLEKDLNKTCYNSKIVLKSCYVKVQDIFKSVPNDKVSPQKLSNWNKKLHVCEVCDKFYRYKRDLNLHYLTHSTNKQFVCNLCNKSFLTQRDLFAHHFAHSIKRKHVCSICKKKFLCKSMLLRHKLIHTDEKPFACNKCDKTFTAKSTLTDHYTTHSNARPFVCEICSQAFRLRSSLRRHYYGHKKKSRCDLCFKTFKRSDHLEAHYNSHINGRPHKCKICNKAFNFLLPLYRHYTIHHRGERPFTLPVSVKTRVDCKIKKKPIIINVETPVECNIEKNPVFQKQSYVCDLCHQTFKHTNKLEEHYNIHTDKKPYKCFICNKAFHLLLTLNNHFCVAHGKGPIQISVRETSPVNCKTVKNPGIKSHVCHLCSKAFRYKNNLLDHYNIHTNNKPHKCKICNQDFHFLVTLNYHKRVTHGEERNFKYTAPAVTKIAKDPVIQISVRETSPVNCKSVKNPVIKSHVCDLCSKAFKLKNKLLDHYNIHTNNKPHKCKICNKDFHLLVTLNHHKCVAHGENRNLKYTAPAISKIAKDPVIEKIKVIAEVHKSDKTHFVEKPTVEIKKDTFTYNTRRKSTTPRRYLQQD